jgi:hypothetical protein
MWGFPTRGTDGVALWDKFYGTGGNPNLDTVGDNHFYVEFGVMHEMSHARYLSDTYAWTLNPQKMMDDCWVTKLDGSRLIPPETYTPWYCWGGLMGCTAQTGRDHLYDKVDVYAWNRVSGQRAQCGNQNWPCNGGAFLLDLPSEVRIQVKDGAGSPVSGATVEVFQSIKDPTTHLDFYDKQIDAVADITCTTDGRGTCSIGSRPFGQLSNGWDAAYKGVAVIRARAHGGEGFRLLYLPEVVEAFVAGEDAQATFVVSDPSL